MNTNINFIDTQYGKFCLIEKDLIGNTIKERGSWEPHLMFFYFKFIKPNFIIVDGGANLGFHSVCFASLLKEGKLFCFEPQPLVYNVLSTNLLINGLSNKVNQYRLGLSDKKQDLRMSSLSEQVFNPNCINWGGRGLTDSKEGEEEVQTITLDSLKLPKLDLIKLDIQGFEYKALKGGEKTIVKNTPIIFLENYLDNKDDQKTLRLLKKWGYVSYRLLCTEHKEDCILLNPLIHQEEIKIIETQTQIKTELT